MEKTIIFSVIWLGYFSTAMCDSLDDIQDTINVLQKELIQRQVFIEERTRTDGDSGVNRVRVNKVNSKPYHTATFAEDSFLGMHDHAHGKYTIGLGEFTAVLNGIEFRLPHTDYIMDRPHLKKSGWQDRQFVNLPSVPDSVSTLTDVNEQIEEMKMYFKAWKEQDDDLRDYVKYFQPFLCYLEGWWENDNGHTEAREHDRARFGAYSGTANKFEDVQFLPRMVLNADGESEFAQWQYRVMCHKMNRNNGKKFKFDLDQLRVIDDLATRMSLGLTLDEYADSPAARFEVNPASPDREWSDSFTGYTFLDKIMEKIPGLDNFPGNLEDTDCGEALQHPLTDQPLNTAFYHRYIRDPSTNEVKMRAFADRSVYFARTTQNEVANVTTNTCTCSDNTKCTGAVTQKWSFAIPIEIIFTTPLSVWNPYNIENKGNPESRKGRTVTENGRHGGFETATAFDGSNRDVHYITPSEFFVDQNLKIGVLDSNGVVHNATASGHRMGLPDIAGVGKMRQRYPIAPVHEEGNHAWKIYDAMKEIIMRPFTYTDMFLDEWNPTIDGSNDGAPIDQLTPGANTTLQTTLSASGGHQHNVIISVVNVGAMVAGDRVTISTETSHHHSHDLVLEYHGNADTPWLEIVTCGGINHCSDGHKNHLIPLTTA